ncbi:MAG: site-2 protease family protein [Methanomassiliicoccales archaeon]|jgi:Zn-dependent protease
MRTSFCIGSFKSIPIYFNVTLLLILPLYSFVFGYGHYVVYGFPLGFGDSVDENVEHWALGLSLTIGFYMSILVHELSHAWMAKRIGYNVTMISLYFFGGFSEFEVPRHWPKGEANIAITGPLASIIVGLGLLILYSVIFDQYDPSQWSIILTWISGFGLLNLLLGVFNLFTFIPLDGGLVMHRILDDEFGTSMMRKLISLVIRVFAILLVVLGVIIPDAIVFFGGVLLYISVMYETQWQVAE